MKSQRLLRMDAARIWGAALRSVDPGAAIRKTMNRKGSTLEIGRRRFDLTKIRRLWVLGAGKAAAPMGQAAEKILGRYLSGGVLATKYGHGLPLKKLDIIEAAHPLPDSNSIASAARILSLAKDSITSDDLVICLLSGGASSLLVSPAEGISLEDKLTCTRLLLNNGADIYELNAIRKHLSNIKGGGLARLLAPSPAIALILSDVVGDDLGTIASGPLAPDSTTFGDCLDIIHRLQIEDQIPPAVKRRFELGAAGKTEETPKKDDRIFERMENFLIGSNSQACTAAAKAARSLGYSVMVLTSRLEGDNEEAARFHMSMAGEIVFQGRPLRRPACIISGGETTVKVKGAGKGGRNQEFALHCVRALARLPSPCLVASIGTDGTDGPTDAAGAIADNTTLTRSLKHGADFLNQSIGDNDSYHFFKRLGDLILTGPTRTNVMDLHLVMLG
ncbi:MAG: glycerate kinase [Acidobacteria bacterium]|nr:glycerate kinase [Acidobacteriota bacterium]